jgi:hypothetical protein
MLKKPRLNSRNKQWSKNFFKNPLKKNRRNTNKKRLKKLSKLKKL